MSHKSNPTESNQKDVVKDDPKEEEVHEQEDEQEEVHEPQGDDSDPEPEEDTDGDENEHSEKPENVVQPPTSPKPNAPPEPAKKSNKVVIIIVAVVVYIALMTIAGGVVYVTYGSGSANVPLVTTPRPTQIFANPNLPNPNLPNPNFPNQNLPNQNLQATNPQTPIITQPGDPASWPNNQQPTQTNFGTTQNALNSNACVAQYAPCPQCRPASCVPQPNSPNYPNSCVPRSTTPCAPMASCPNGQCRPPCTAPTRQPDPPFSEFETNRAGRWQSKSVAEWINMFAPYSRERLNVVITLLDETVEKWAYAGFAHRCAPSSVKSPYLIHNTKCTFCNDRYSYIKCVMSGEVAGPINPYGQTHLFFDDNALRNARHNIPYILWNSVSQVINLVTHFVNIEKAIQPFQVKRADGIECRVCADFNRKVYDRCISHDRVYEGP